MTIDTTTITSNPFAAITIMAAPAILTNASSILTLSTSTRLMRCLDRISVLTERLGRSDLDKSLRETFAQQIELSHKQSRQFLSALRWIYITLASFAFASFGALVGAASLSFVPHFATETLAILSLASGGLGIVGFIWASFNLVTASRITVQIMSADMEHFRRHNKVDLV